MVRAIFRVISEKDPRKTIWGIFANSLNFYYICGNIETRGVPAGVRAEIIPYELDAASTAERTCSRS